LKDKVYSALAESVRAAFEESTREVRMSLMMSDMRLYITLCRLVEQPKAAAQVHAELNKRRKSSPRFRETL
jgi:hypothetical protein